MAFYVRADVQPTDPVRSADIVMPDGHPAAPLSLVACGTCGEPLAQGAAARAPRFAVLTWQMIGEELDFVREDG